MVTGVKVKGLEWSSEPPYSVARVFRGFYSTEWVEETGVCELRGTFMRVDFPTVAEAKAAAQANYERHVLSALEPQQEEAVAVWIEREALSELLRHKTATTTVCSGLLSKPFGDNVPPLSPPHPCPESAGNSDGASPWSHP